MSIVKKQCEWLMLGAGHLVSVHQPPPDLNTVSMLIITKLDRGCSLRQGLGTIFSALRIDSPAL